MKTIKLLAILFISTLVFTGCSDSDPDDIIDEEFWTDFRVEFENENDPTDRVILTVFDADGEPGPTAPITTVTGKFTAGETYNASMSLDNTVENEDVLNDDIIPEADEHFFTFAVSGINMTVSRDSDDVVRTDGAKLGVKTTWSTPSVGTGNLQIRLVHEPDTVNDSNGFGTTTGGSEDINVTFSVEVE